MSDTLNLIRDFMEKEGIPGRDAHDLPTSEKSFPDGAQYRIEIAGVERASTMAAFFATGGIGRVIGAFSGGFIWSRYELFGICTISGICTFLALVSLIWGMKNN